MYCGKDFTQSSSYTAAVKKTKKKADAEFQFETGRLMLDVRTHRVMEKDSFLIELYMRFYSNITFFLTQRVK